MRLSYRGASSTVQKRPSAVRGIALRDTRVRQRNEKRLIFAQFFDVVESTPDEACET